MPAQTPVNYLKGGGAAMFSAACIKAMLKCALNPNWFGSYAHVKEKVIKPARDKCRAWDQASQPDRNAGKLETPTAEDRYLAKCSSGHLLRDSNYRESGGRGNPCKSLVDGYETTRAPSTTHWGSADNSNGEHGKVTINENNQSRQQRERNAAKNAPDTYPAGQRARDESARVAAYVSDHQRQWRQSEEEWRNQKRGAGTAQGATGTHAQTTAASDSGANGPASKPLPTPPDAKAIDGDMAKAAACINNWRKKAEKAMKQKCQDDLEKNKAKVAETVKENKGTSVEQVQTKLDQRAQRKRAEADRARQKNGGTPDEAKEAAAQAAKGDATRFRNQNCRIKMGEALAAGRGRTSGRPR